MSSHVWLCNMMFVCSRVTNRKHAKALNLRSILVKGNRQHSSDSLLGGGHASFLGIMPVDLSSNRFEMRTGRNGPLCAQCCAPKPLGTDHDLHSPLWELTLEKKSPLLQAIAFQTPTLLGKLCVERCIPTDIKRYWEAIGTLLERYWTLLDAIGTLCEAIGHYWKAIDVIRCY